MSARRPLDLQRLQHVDGELLRARDLRDQLAADLELHWWHQRAVHTAYGVASGLGVSEPDADGLLTVDPGVAYDARGRDLVLLDPATVRTPAAGDPVYLVARYRPVAPGVDFAWLAPARFDPCEGVALARLDWAQAPIVQPLAPPTRPVTRPRLGWGTTPPDRTPWEPWAVIYNGSVSGLQVRVDTGAAGFTDTPCYFASLQWPGASTDVADPSEYQLFGLQYVQDAAIGGFTFRVVAERVIAQGPGLAAAGGDASTLVRTARMRGLHVCWLGIQGEDDATTGA